MNDNFTTRAEAEAERLYGKPPYAKVKERLAFRAGVKWRDEQPLTLTAADLEAAVTAVMGAKLPYPICGDGCCTGTNLLTFTQARWVLEAALKAIPNIVLPESEVNHG